ncbi:hypothetical protein KJ654_00980 [Patescibacteria group bacterium]|nr:hypothetical protein [Patescibacteria group bacterium]MBU1966827.1 hypothetical protein [Patescibacteria group bacterium]
MIEAKDKTKTGLTLTEATHLGRLLIKYGGITLAVLIVGRIFFTSLIAFWRAINPPPPPPPTVGFGRLPAIMFPKQLTESKPASYTLETPTGTTSVFGDRAKVFLMLRSTPSLLADQRAKQIASIYNFVFEPDVLGANIYRWKKSQPLEMQLQMNIFNNHFELTSNYASKPELLSNSKLPDDYEAVQRVKNFLKNADLLPEDVATAAGEILYMKSLGGEFKEAVSFSDADFLQVDLNRIPIDGVYRMYGPMGYRGAIHAVISGAFQGNNSIVELDYTYQAVDYQQRETYPIRTSQQAYQILKSGEAYIANLGNQETVVIRKVSLGYFEAKEEQDYLQPIYVFEGDGGFLAYVAAVAPEYVQVVQ